MIAALATSVVFAMTLIMSGMSNGLDAEIDRLVDSFHADSWVVARGASGPFTATKFVVDDDVNTGEGRVRGAGGVADDHGAGDDRHDVAERREPASATCRAAWAHPRSPRVARRSARGEILVDDKLDADVGERRS